MSLKAMCHQTTASSVIANQFGAIKKSHDVAIEQILRSDLGHIPHYKILDLGVGSGSLLKKLHHFMPYADFTGMDISSEQLAKAKKVVPCKIIEGNALQADKYLPAHSQDLVLAHFINAHMPLHTLLEEANRLTRANGHFSLITTTYDSFPAAQRALAQFIAQGTVLSKVIGHYYKSILKNTTVAANREELILAFEQHEFEIKDHIRMEIPINFNDIDEFVMYGIEGTWFLNAASMRMLPKNFLVQRVTRLFSKIFTLPYQDKHIIDIILAKK